MKKSYESGVGAAMLADVPAGESPVGGACSVATVVIPDDEKGDRLIESSGVKAPDGWVKCPVRSASGASNSTGRSEWRTREAAKVRPI
jgi:hypothetical protein